MVGGASYPGAWLEEKGQEDTVEPWEAVSKGQTGWDGRQNRSQPGFCGDRALNCELEGNTP